MRDRTSKEQRLSRRAVMVAAGVGIGTGAFPAHAQSSEGDLAQEIQALPNISGHEHWGSIPIIGNCDGGFHADLKAGIEPENASLFDLLFEPYSGMNFQAMGVDPHADAKAQGLESMADWGRKDPQSAWQSAKRIYQPARSTGWFSCTAQGIQALYDVDLHALFDDSSSNIEPVLRLDQAIRERYRSLVAWYKEAMQKLRIETILRPVQLEFGYRQDNAGERDILSPLLRIDQYCSFYQKRTSAIEFCVQHTGVDPKNADEFREFLSKCFEAADKTGFRGTKQLQAYSRPLNFERPKDSDVCFEATDDREKRRIFGNFVVYECMELTAKRDWPHQVHVGTHNVPRSEPLALEPLVRAFPQVRFVLLHCWPFIRESAYLAKSRPNVFLDTCWTPVLSPAIFREFMDLTVGYLPDIKVCIGHDSTSIEMAAGSAAVSRSILSQVLEERIQSKFLTMDSAIALAKRYLADNAREVYR
ncbi:MAG TPA: amidohydrolase family protein, partial [bacterium]|nr:amidohydrolase family protein [bacterium]